MSEQGEKNLRDLMKSGEIPTFVSFKDEKTQRMTYDPLSIARLFKGGQYGDSWAVPVETAPGVIKWLRVKSGGLREQLLDKVKTRSLIEISQTGSGTGTKYGVKVVSK